METLGFLHDDLLPGNIYRIISKVFDIFPELLPRINKHQRNFSFFTIYDVNYFRITQFYNLIRNTELGI